MQVCSNCSEENPARFRLCGFCGTPLAPGLVQPELRKIVTILFSDLKDSTGLGERLDPESLRAVLSRYFDVMRSVLEEHGGSIEKYIGDAIMAVFGLPRVHEDDALRAVRAAAAMQDALGTLNDDLERRWGVRLANRTGIATGEVVAGDATGGQRLVSGDTVNVAARLEQVAPPLGVLIGEPTYRLVRGAVDLERVEPLELKGKAERVVAYRLIGVRESTTAVRHPDLPLVGRETELKQLLDAFEAVQKGEAARVVALFGDAGVGKTRLADELVQALATRARVLRGRCLSYGHGITFWPLVEIARDAAAIRESDPPEVGRQKLEQLVPGLPEVAARVASAVGIGETTFPLGEIAWATRKLLEALAAERPCVVLLEELHWAEAAFVELIEYAAAHVAAPVLIVCSARPDLLDTHPGWRDQPSWLRIDLEPLTPAQSRRLIEDLLGTSDLPARIYEQVGAASQGNPLFVEQLVAMLVDDGHLRQEAGAWQVGRSLAGLAMPASIHALLAARLDLLTPHERAVLEPAAVIGQRFALEALMELVDDAARPVLDQVLGELVRKRLLQADEDAADGRWYLFRHILIRDTAYGRLLKRTRALLHQRFADWAERVKRDGKGAVEYDEILGYHLEQAYRYLGELAPLDEQGMQLGARGATHLGAAGLRAFERGDMGAASNLLRRAVSLLPVGAPARLELLPSLGEALMESGDFAAAEESVNEPIETAADGAEDRLLADAMLSRLLVRHHTSDDLGAWRAEVQRETARWIPSLERQQADAELAKAWRLVAFVSGTVCQWQATVTAEQQAIEHARRAGQRRLEARLSAALAQALRDGPTPVEEAIRRCQELLATGLVDQHAEVLTTLHLAYLLALKGDLSAARRMAKSASTRLEDLAGGALSPVTQASVVTANIELLADDAAAAVDELECRFKSLTELGERYFRPLVGALLVQALCAAERYDEAFALTLELEPITAADDVEAQVLWHSARAKALARRGDIEQALQLMDDAVNVGAPTDALVIKGDALRDRAAVLIQAGRVTEAANALQDARALYDQKQATMPLRRLDALLAGLEVLLPSRANGAASQSALTPPSASQRSPDRLNHEPAASRSHRPRQKAPAT